MLSFDALQNFADHAFWVIISVLLIVDWDWDKQVVVSLLLFYWERLLEESSHQLVSNWSTQSEFSIVVFHFWADQLILVRHDSNDYINNQKCDKKRETYKREKLTLFIVLNLI